MVLLFLRERPADVGAPPYGGTPADVVAAAAHRAARLARRARCSGRPAPRTFWLLVGGFFVCGATTNGLVGTHFIPARTTTACR